MSITPDGVRQYFEWRRGITRIFNTPLEELRKEMRPEWLALIDKDIDNEKERWMSLIDENKKEGECQ